MTVGQVTSVSSSCTKLPALPIKFHTSAASSSMPWSCPEAALLTPASPENEPADCAGREELSDFIFRMDKTWPLVLRMAPDARSKIMVALTPGFLERRPNVSSRAASGPVPCEWCCQTELRAVRIGGIQSLANLPRLCLTCEARRGGLSVVISACRRGVSFAKSGS